MTRFLPQEQLTARGHNRELSAQLIFALGFAALAGACGDDSGDPAPEDTSEVDTRPADTAPGPDEACIDQQNGTPCDDGDVCTEDDKCIQERCRGVVSDCDDGDDCTDDVCDVAAGGCVYSPNTAPCSDGNPCTTGDSCSADGCVGNAVSELACNDDNVCTTQDTCESGVCVGQPNDCNDLNTCTADFCDASHPDAEVGTGCVHEAKSEGSCTDDNPCTDNDTCTEGVCVGSVVAGGPCSDGNACTDGDVCSESGECTGEAIVCDDDDVCTLDECAPAFGCRHPAAPGVLCDDGDLCTTADVCDEDAVCAGDVTLCPTGDACLIGTCDPSTGGCVEAPRECDDDNPCTGDTCDSSTGCVHPPIVAACDDGDACTTGDQCQNGSCVAVPTVCDSADDNDCQANLCSASTGECQLTLFNGATCDDGALCTTADVCSGGMCVGTPATCADGDPCTVDSCDPTTGDCAYAPLSQQECGDLALDRSNEYRTLLALPLLNNHEAIIAAATAHCEYYVNNPSVFDAGLSAHNEEPGLPGYTGAGFGERMIAAGYPGQPMFEVMAFVNDPVIAVDEWMATLYHRIPFVLPSAYDMGYGAAQKGFDSCDTIDFGRAPTGSPAWEGLIIPFPPDGMIDVPTYWDGYENPQPPLPNPYPSGPILTVSFTAETGYPGIAIVDSAIHGPDGPVPHVANDPQTDADLCCGIVALYPNMPLEPMTTYTVVLDYSRNGAQGTFQWSFTTGTGAIGPSGIYFLD